MSSIRDAYEQGIGFYNAGDVEGLVNLCTEDATRVTPSGTFEGRAAIHEAASREKAAFPDRTMTVDVCVEQGDTIAAEWTFVGTNTGPLVMPDGTELPRPASGSSSKAWSWCKSAAGRQPWTTCTGTTWLSPGSSVFCRSQPPDPGISGETARR